MKRIASAVAVATLLAANHSGAAPRGPIDPNWPCQSVKVSDLSVASFWSGPAIDPSRADWRGDEPVATLAEQVAQRRMPLAEADAKILAFATSRAADRQAALTSLFAGIFEILDAERNSVVAGLDRFGERQKTLADNLREEGERLRAAQAAPAPDAAGVTQLTQQVTWDMQLFEARRQSVSFACDVPTTIEQRLFALARTIQQAMQ